MISPLALVKPFIAGMASATLIPMVNLMAAEKLPNTLILYADDLGYGDLGCYNAKSKIPTPSLDKLASQFNNRQLQTPDGHTMNVNIVTYEQEKMVETALEMPEFQAISPDSSLWLDRLDQQWSAAQDEASDPQIRSPWSSSGWASLRTRTPSTR